MSANIVYAILVTSLATFLSRFLGAVSSEGIKETSKLFKWFNCFFYLKKKLCISNYFFCCKYGNFKQLFLNKIDLFIKLT